MGWTLIVVLLCVGIKGIVKLGMVALYHARERLRPPTPLFPDGLLWALFQAQVRLCHDGATFCVK